MLTRSLIGSFALHTTTERRHQLLHPQSRQLTLLVFLLISHVLTALLASIQDSGSWLRKLCNFHIAYCKVPPSTTARHIRLDLFAHIIGHALQSLAHDV